MERVLFSSISIILAFFVLVNAEWVDVGSDLIGRVIHVESLRYQGYWIDSRSRPWLSMAHGIREEDIYTTERSKFQVIDCGNGEVCLETVEVNNKFLKAGYVILNVKDPMVGFKTTTYPKSHGNLRWTIKCEDSSMSKCRIDNNYYKSTLYTNTLYFAATGAYVNAPVCHFRIISPKATDRFVTILETENHSSLQQSKTISMSEGISHSTSSTFSSSLSGEIKFAFLAGANLNVNWAQTSSKTYESSTTFSYKLAIPPKTKLTFKQLTGSYGPFTVAAKKFQILSTKL